MIVNLHNYYDACSNLSRTNSAQQRMILSFVSYFCKDFQNVRMILASSDSSLSLDKLADLADKVAEVALPTVATVTETPPHLDEVTHLRAEVTQLKELVQSMHNELCRRLPKPRHSPSPAHPRQTREPSTLCWYHRKFGDAGQKCHEPCPQGLNTQASH